MANPTHARMAKEVPGLTTFIASRTRSSLQHLSVSMIELPRRFSPSLPPFPLTALTFALTLFVFEREKIFDSKSRRNLRYADVQGPTGPILRSQELKAQGKLAKAEAKVCVCDSLASAFTSLVDSLRFCIAILACRLNRVAPFAIALFYLASCSIHPPWMLERHWQSRCTPDRWIRC